jgi:hypothetical protein
MAATNLRQSVHGSATHEPAPQHPHRAARPGAGSVGPVEPTPPSAGWHPDPSGRYDFRYYNGQRWTSDVSVAGQRFVEPSVAPAMSPVPQFDPANRRGLALASFCVGLSSLLVAWLPFVFVLGIVGAIVAVVLGCIARGRIRRNEAGGQGFVTAGLLLAVAALAASVLGFMFTRVVLRELDHFFERRASTTSASTDCNVNDRLATVEGSITNLDDEQRSYTIFVSYRDGDELLDTDQTVVRSVAPGATATFVASEFVDADDADSTDLICSIETVTGPALFTPGGDN